MRVPLIRPPSCRQKPVVCWASSRGRSAAKRCMSDQALTKVLYARASSAQFFRSQMENVTTQPVTLVLA
jgi:hypothetical protein